MLTAPPVSTGSWATGPATRRASARTVRRARARACVVAGAPHDRAGLLRRGGEGGGAGAVVAAGGGGGGHRRVGGGGGCWGVGGLGGGGGGGGLGDWQGRGQERGQGADALQHRLARHGPVRERGEGGRG